MKFKAIFFGLACTLTSALNLETTSELESSKIQISGNGGIRIPRGKGPGGRNDVTRNGDGLAQITEDKGPGLATSSFANQSSSSTASGFM